MYPSDSLEWKIIKHLESVKIELESWNEDLKDMEGAQEVMKDEQISNLEFQIESLTKDLNEWKTVNGFERWEVQVKKLEEARDRCAKHVRQQEIKYKKLEGENAELKQDLKLQEQDNERIIQSSKGAVERMKAERDRMIKVNFDNGECHIAQKDILRREIEKLTREKSNQKNWIDAQEKTWKDLKTQYEKLKAENTELLIANKAFANGSIKTWSPTAQERELVINQLRINLAKCEKLRLDAEKDTVIEWFYIKGTLNIEGSVRCNLKTGIHQERIDGKWCNKEFDYGFAKTPMDTKVKEIRGIITPNGLFQLWINGEKQ